MELIEALNWRYAVKRFSGRVVEADKLRYLLEAARLSASAYGLQPYRILSIRSGDLRRRLVEHAYGQDKVLNSSHLLVFAAQTRLGDDAIGGLMARIAASRNQPVAELAAYAGQIEAALASWSPAERVAWAKNQAYLALGNLLAAAALLKVDACPMEGFDAGGFDRVLGLAERGLTTAVICPVGYRHPEDPYAGYPKVRMDSAELVLEL
jgi:nitroreductase/dihydropteridine reductase